MGQRIAIIGGGSSAFVPHLLRLFIESPVLKGSTITLMDVDAQRLAVMETLGRRLVAAEDAALTITSTTEQRAALVGADFVIVAIAVGGLAAWEQDIEITARHGIFAEKQDSIGPGGIMRAFRHVPILTSIACDLADVAPHATVLNYTNPAAANALALRTVPDIQAVSLCSCVGLPMNAQWLGAWAGVPAEEIAMPPLAAGLNHCAALVSLRLKDGREVLPQILGRDRDAIVAGLQAAYQGADQALLQRVQEIYGMRSEQVVEMFLESTGLNASVTPWIIQTFGVVPYCWTHWVEFFPALLRRAEPYQGRAQGLRLQHGLRIVDTVARRARAQRWQDLAERWSQPEHAGEVALANMPVGEQDEGIEVVAIMEAMVENRNAVHIINTLNDGAIDNLPHDAIVEVSTLVNGYGMRPLHVGPLPAALAAHLRRHIDVQKLTVEAALTGDHRTALQAFLLDPMVEAVQEPAQTAQMLDELLTAHARYLPQFA